MIPLRHHQSQALEFPPKTSGHYYYTTVQKCEADVCGNEPLPVPTAMQQLYTPLTSQGLQPGDCTSTHNYLLFPQGCNALDAMCSSHVGVTVHSAARSHYVLISFQPQNHRNVTTGNKEWKSLFTVEL